jgi:hypothetical protein
MTAIDKERIVHAALRDGQAFRGFQLPAGSRDRFRRPSANYRHQGSPDRHSSRAIIFSSGKG